MGEAVMISGLGPYTREAYFGKEGPSRVMEEIGILEISSTDVKCLGEYNLDPIESRLWLLDPPITIPRTLELDEPVVNMGVVTNGAVSVPYAHNFMIVESEVSVTTPSTRSGRARGSSQENRETFYQ